MSAPSQAMPGLAVFFVRHGESTANAGAPAMPHALIPLSLIGLSQAHGVASSRRFDPPRVVCSRMIRTWETAEPLLSALGMGLEADARLDEFSCVDEDRVAGMGTEERRPLAQAYWAALDPQARHGPKADTFAEFAGRVDAFMEEMPSLPDRSVVFGHGIWIAMLAWRMAGGPVDSAAAMSAFKGFQSSLPMPNAGIHAARQGLGGWRMGRIAKLATPGEAWPEEETDAAALAVAAMSPASPAAAPRA